jgi:hypothetical protein
MFCQCGGFQRSNLRSECYPPPHTHTHTTLKSLRHTTIKFILITQPPCNAHCSHLHDNHQETQLSVFLPHPTASPPKPLIPRILSCIKVKVNFSLCFSWAPCHEEVLGKCRYSSTQSLTSALDGVERSASSPCRFTLRESAPGTHWIGGWVGPRAVLDAVVKRKIPSPPGNRTLESRSSSS